MHVKLETKKGLIIFDLDGTLIDSREDIAGSINAGLAVVAGITVAKEEIIPLIGKPLVEMYAVLLPEGSKHLTKEASAAYRAHYMDNCAVRTRIFSGVKEGLELLRGERMAVATTKAGFQARRVVQAMGLSEWFELVQGTDGIPHKPDPAVILQVFDILGGDPASSWMVGDTSYDILAGKAAGMRTCAVTYGIGTAKALAASKPDLTVDDLADFARFVTE